jgi:hypothetical protein
MKMELEIAQKIYSGKYRERMDFEYYTSILEKGFRLLQEQATKRLCSKTERDAMRMALEYNLEQMFS